MMNDFSQRQALSVDRAIGSYDFPQHFLSSEMLETETRASDRSRNTSPCEKRVPAKILADIVDTQYSELVLPPAPIKNK